MKVPGNIPPRSPLLEPLLEPTPLGAMARIIQVFRRRVLTGALIMVPLVVSLIPVMFVYPRLNALAKSQFGIDQPFVGFVVALLVVLFALYVVGLLSTTFVIRWTMKAGESVVTQIPVVSFFYRTAKQVVDLMVSSASKPFKKAVMVEYPKQGSFVVGFVTGESVYPDPLGHLVHVFVPTTPNPTSGFLLLYRPDDVTETHLTIEEAIRFIISGGILKIGDMRLSPYETTLAPPETGNVAVAEASQ